MKIEILGTGCTKCTVMAENAKTAISKSVDFMCWKSWRYSKIMDYGVMSTPALVVDGVVKSTGKTIKVEEIIELIK